MIYQLFPHPSNDIAGLVQEFGNSSISYHIVGFSQISKLSLLLGGLPLHEWGVLGLP